MDGVKIWSDIQKVEGYTTNHEHTILQWGNISRKDIVVD